MTFEELKDSITDWLAKEDNQITDTVRGQLINMAQRRLLRNYDTRFGQYAYSFPTADNDEDYAVPTGYSRTYEIWYNDSGKVNLMPLTREEFTARFGTNSTKGTPTHYTIWENQLFLGPKPDGIYTIYWDCFIMLADLADGSPNNSNDVTTYAWEYLLFRALDYATKYLVEDNRAQLWEAQANQMEGDIVREHSRERTVHRRPITQEPG